jgi:hypothetical protein
MGLMKYNHMHTESLRNSKDFRMSVLETVKKKKKTLNWTTYPQHILNMETLCPIRKNMKVSFLEVEVVNNMFCRYHFVKIHSIVPWKWNNDCFSEQCTLYLCWLREGGRKNTKGFVPICVSCSKIDYPFHLCILFYFSMFIV